MKLSRAKRLRLTESVIDQLIARLRSGDSHPGDKLPSERELMAQTGVGRSSVREALQALIGMNLVAAHPGRGYFVKASDWRPLPADRAQTHVMEGSALLDLIDARMLVEPEIAALAAKSATDADREAVEQALQRIASQAKRGRQVYRAAAKFHAELAKATHNAALVQMVSSLVSVMAWWGRVFEDIPGQAQREVELHRKLFECLKRQDPDEMRHQMREHVAATRQALVTYLTLRERAQPTRVPKRSVPGRTSLR